MKKKVSELSGAQLDWAVAKCEIPNDIRDNRPCFWVHPNNPRLICRQTYNHEANPKGYELCQYSTSWAQGGPIIEREVGNLWKNNKIDPSEPDVWVAAVYVKTSDEAYVYHTDGSTP